MVDVLLLLDSSGCVRYCSDTSTTVLGLRSEEVVGQVLPELLGNKLRHAITEESFSSLWDLVINPLDACKTVDITYSDPQRKEYVATAFSLSTSQFTNLEGTMTGLTIRDVTEEREIERRRDTFIAMLSHELRDPVTAMMGFTRLLMEAGPLNSTQLEWLQNIYTCGQRLTTITCDMLDVEGIRTGNLTVNLGPVDLRSVIDEVLPLISETYGAVDCSVRVSPDLPEVMADKTRVAQVLGNLLSNAVKYSPQGGRVSVCAHEDPERQRVVIDIADQGCGIPPEDLENVFTPFQRSLRPETREVKGIGLGLYIVQGLVELMHGNIWVESQVGKGSTFHLALPTLPGPSGPEWALKMSEEASG